MKMEAEKGKRDIIKTISSGSQAALWLSYEVEAKSLSTVL